MGKEFRGGNRGNNRGGNRGGRGGRGGRGNNRGRGGIGSKKFSKPKQQCSLIVLREYI